MMKHVMGLSQRVTSLTTTLSNSYVIRYTPKRSPFDKTTYNEEWIPREKLYHKTRKPRQPEWDDPEVVFPKLIPPLYKPCAFKHYVKNVIEQEETQKARRSKEYLLTDIRSGDIVDITFQETFQSPQTTTHRGLVLSFKRKRSWTAAIEVAIRFGGMSLKCIYLVNSPKVKKIELIAKGSGCFRSSIKNDWQKLNKTRLTTPKIKKRVMKARSQGKKKKVVQRRKSSSINYDEIITDNVKRLI